MKIKSGAEKDDKSLNRFIVDGLASAGQARSWAAELRALESRILGAVRGHERRTFREELEAFAQITLSAMPHCDKMMVDAVSREFAAWGASAWLRERTEQLAEHFGLRKGNEHAGNGHNEPQSQASSHSA